jgi:thiamine biosynthesis lipoprotein
MACDFEVRLNPKRFPQGMESALDALDIVTDLGRRWSFFLEDSEVARINALAGSEPVFIADDLFEVLELARRISAETQGAFDITSAPLLEVWGFSRREGRMPHESALAAALERVGMDLIELDHQRRTIRFLKPGVRINLGSIGKGWAVDRAGDRLVADGVGTFLIHGGNSSVLARSLPPDAQKERTPRSDWEIGLGHPLRRGERLLSLKLENTALGTSGSAHQFFMHQGRRLGHVIDPRTGRPTDRVLSVTVFAPTAVEADALATAFFVLGPEKGEEYCLAHTDIGMIFVPAPSKAGPLEVLKVGRCPIKSDVGE